MIMGSSYLQLRSTDLRRVCRWLLLGFASVLLHLWLLNWADDKIKALPDQDAPVIHTVLISPEPAAPVPARPVPPAPPKKIAHPRHKSRPALSAPPLAQTVSFSPAPAAVSPDAGPSLDSIEANAHAVADGEQSPFAVLPDATAPAPSGKEAGNALYGERYKVEPPPSADLKYDVQALREGQTLYGHGDIGWKFDGTHYSVSGDAGVLFISVLNFGSEGDVDPFGIAPLLYHEKRFRKSETNTHFNRERNVISFSSSTVSYQRQGGEQDRATILWQLAGIGRADPEKFFVNAQIPVFVAGVRDGEVWNIKVVGQEDIDIGTGKTSTWHLVRTPRPGSYDQTIDIWLAPGQEWYPVRLRYTEVNGNYLDMSLASITPMKR
jgi:hypothetical protein